MTKLYDIIHSSFNDNAPVELQKKVKFTDKNKIEPFVKSLESFIACCNLDHLGALVLSEKIQYYIYSSFLTLVDRETCWDISNRILLQLR